MSSKLIRITENAKLWLSVYLCIVALLVKLFFKGN